MSTRLGGSFTSQELRVIADKAGCIPEMVTKVLVGATVSPDVDRNVRIAVGKIYGWIWPTWDTTHPAKQRMTVGAALEKTASLEQL
jgi:hypothetical protein